MREGLQGIAGRVPEDGITPAYAGRTVIKSFEDELIEDHPRLCGKDNELFSEWTINRGSPPLMREGHSILAQHPDKSGITPAYAGRTIED